MALEPMYRQGTFMLGVGGSDETLLTADPNAKHLGTGHLLANLERRAISSGLVALVSQGIQVVLGVASIVLLARLLSPDDFGLVAMSMTVMGFLRVFKEVGLSTATIQREGITHAQVSNLFWLNVFISGAVSLILAVGAPLVAWFYREPRLGPITVVLATTFPLSGLIVQHTALLTRQMRFKALAVIQVASQVAGIGTAIAMSWLGFGYWSLVGLSIATSVTTVLLTYIAVPWRPQAPRRQSGTRPLLSFGANLAAGGFVFSLARGSDALAIGRLYGSGSLGLYSRAAALLSRPMEQLLAAAEAVLVPMLSRLQHQPERYRSTFLRFYEAIALCGCLCTGLLLALARPVTLLILGPQWESAAIILAGLSISALCAPLTALASWLFASQGRGRHMLVSTSLVSGAFVASVALGLPFGPAGVAFANSAIGLLVGVPVLYYLAGREGPVKTVDLWIGFLRYVPLWAVVCGVTFATRLVVADFTLLVQLVISMTVGLGAAGTLIWASGTMRRTALEIINLPRELLASRVADYLK